MATEPATASSIARVRPTRGAAITCTPSAGVVCLACTQATYCSSEYDAFNGPEVVCMEHCYPAYTWYCA